MIVGKGDGRRREGKVEETKKKLMKDEGTEGGGEEEEALEREREQHIRTKAVIHLVLVLNLAILELSFIFYLFIDLFNNLIIIIIIIIIIMNIIIYSRIISIGYGQYLDIYLVE